MGRVVAGIIALVATTVAPVVSADRATAQSEFSITSTIAALPGCSDPAQLYPGVERCLRYRVHNPFAVSITVTSIELADVSAPRDCPASNLDLTGTTFSGVLEVPAGETAAAPGVSISLVETGRNQDSCQGATFVFTYSGSATSESGDAVEGGGEGEPEVLGRAGGAEPPGDGAGSDGAGDGGDEDDDEQASGAGPEDDTGRRAGGRDSWLPVAVAAAVAAIVAALLVAARRSERFARTPDRS